MRYPCLSRYLLLFLLVPVGTAFGDPPTYCRVATAFDDGYAPWCATASSYETFGGAECEPMSIASAWIEKGASMIPSGACGVVAGDLSKSFDTVHRIVPRGAIPLDFKDECIPWKANVRYRKALGGALGAVPVGIMQVFLTMPNGNYFVDGGGGANAHADTTIGGCVPAALVLAKRANAMSRVRAYVHLEVNNLHPVGATFEAEVIGDPLITIDPAWPSAGLFKVEQETAPGSGVWAEVDRDWAGLVAWTDATAGSLARPGADDSASWGDCDNDGDLDVCFMSSAEANVLLRNDGGGVFAEATPPVLAAITGSVFVRWADVDGDGDLDLYITGNNGNNALLRNDGGGAFSDATTPLLANYGYNRDAAWADYDLDGDLDVYLVTCTSGNKLLRNDNGTFTEVTPAALMDAQCGVGAMWGDYDNDRLPDLYLVKSNGPNRLIHNLGGGVFADVTATSGPVGDAGVGQGATWGDYDNDGRLDLYLSNNGANRLLHNGGAGVFADSTGARTASPSNSLISAWADFNNDGNLDLYVQNYIQRNDLVFGLGNHEFDWALWHATGPIEQPGNGGLSVLDLDEDGDLDVYLSRGGLNAVLRNDQDLGNHWLEVDLRGTGAAGGSNHFGIGARVRVVSADGQGRLREISASPGRNGGAPLRAHFGLGAQARIDTLEVRWPSGVVTRNQIPFTADRLVTVHESGQISGVWDAPELPPRPVLFPNAPNPFNPVTFIRYELKAQAQVSLTVYDVAGHIVRSLVNGKDQPAGRYEAPWDGRDDGGRFCGSGVYVYRLEVGAFTDSGKMALLR